VLAQCSRLPGRWIVYTNGAPEKARPLRVPVRVACDLSG